MFIKSLILVVNDELWFIFGYVLLKEMMDKIKVLEFL